MEVQTYLQIGILSLPLLGLHNIALLDHNATPVGIKLDWQGCGI